MQQKEISLLRSRAAKDHKVIQNMERALNSLRGRQYSCDTGSPLPATGSAPLVENNIYCAPGSADIIKKNEGTKIRIFKETKGPDFDLESSEAESEIITPPDEHGKEEVVNMSDDVAGYEDGDNTQVQDANDVCADIMSQQPSFATLEADLAPAKSS